MKVFLVDNPNHFIDIPPEKIDSIQKIKTFVSQVTSIKENAFTLNQNEPDKIELQPIATIEKDHLIAILEKGNSFAKAFLIQVLKKEKYAEETKKQGESIQQTVAEVEIPNIQPEPLPELITPTKGTTLGEQELTIPICKGDIERMAQLLKSVTGDESVVQLASSCIDLFVQIQRMVDGTNNSVDELQMANHLKELIDLLKKFGAVSSIESELRKTDTETEQKAAAANSKLVQWKPVENRPFNVENKKIFSDAISEVKALLALLKERFKVCETNAANYKNFQTFNNVSDALKMVDIQINELERLIKLCVTDINQIMWNLKENEELGQVILGDHEKEKAQLEYEEERLENEGADILMRIQIMQLKYYETMKKRNEVRAMKKRNAEFTSKLTQELKRNREEALSQVSKRENRKKDAQTFASAATLYKQRYAETAANAHAIEVVKKTDYFKASKKELLKSYDALHHLAKLAYNGLSRSKTSLDYFEKRLKEIEEEAQFFIGEAVEKLQEKESAIKQQQLSILEMQDEMTDILDSVENNFHWLLNHIYKIEYQMISPDELFNRVQAKTTDVQVTDLSNNVIVLENPYTKLKLDDLGKPFVPPKPHDPITEAQEKAMRDRELLEALKNKKTLITLTYDSNSSNSNSNANRN